MKKADGRRIKAILFDDLFFLYRYIHLAHDGTHKTFHFLMRRSLLMVPLVVMITHKHLYSKEPYSVGSETNTRSVIIFPSQVLQTTAEVV